MKSNKLLVIVVIVLALLGAGFFAYTAFFAGKAGDNTTSTTSTSTTERGDSVFGTSPALNSAPTTKVPSAAPTTKLQSVATSSFYKLEYSIPDEDAVVASELTGLANAWLSGSGISDVKTAAQARELGISKLNGCPGYEYSADYIKYSTDDYTSYINDGYDFSCGAHGSTVSTTFVYDKKTSKRITTLEDIYKPTIYQKLSDIARSRMPKILAAQDIQVADIQDMFDEGTTPDKNNFNTFYFAGTSLYIVFGQYSIGPYVIGVHTLEIPLGELASYKK
jgi:Protein of unknown function (DUF3298)